MTTYPVQAFPTATTAQAILTLDPDVDLSNGFVVNVCNTSASAAAYSIYVDPDGATFDETTAVAFAVALAGNTVTTFEYKGSVSSAGGAIAVKDANGSRCSFSLSPRRS